jgi:cytochrome c oxidase subunit 1
MTVALDTMLTRPSDARDEEPQGFWRRYVFSTDHKVVGIQYFILSALFAALGGALAMLMRWQLAYPRQAILTPDGYNATFSLHATIMIFFMIIPLGSGAFANYLVPLKIGARTTAMPALGAASVWITLLAGVVLCVRPFLQGGAVGAGWTGYPPLSALWGAGATTGFGWPWVARVAVFVVSFFLCTFVTTRFFSAKIAALWGVIGAGLMTAMIELVAFDGQSSWFVSLLLVGVATTMGAVNLMTTILTMRCKGMTLTRLPLSVWGVLFAAILILLATPVLSVAMVMNLLDHHRLTTFFLPEGWIAGNAVQQTVAGGGYALLHQHLFWFYSHPAVYVMILPAFGIVSDVLSVFARKPVFGYRPMIWAMAAITFLGFFVWAHHMFVSGMNPLLGTTFAISTMFIAVPSGIKVFNWLGTLWRGNLHFTTAMWYAVAFVSLFVVGGLSGIFLASTPVDVHLHDTYFVVAHIHYVLFGGSLFGLLAGVYFWFPKFSGRMLSERLGKVHFVLTYLAFNGVFLPMHILGIRGVPRRYYDISNIESFRDLQPLNVGMTHSALLLGTVQFVFVFNILWSLWRGRKADANPWRAATLEWTDAASPPARENFESTPVVYHGPYEYNNPLATDGDFLPQSRALPTHA